MIFYENEKFVKQFRFIFKGNNFDFGSDYLLAINGLPRYQLPTTFRFQVQLKSGTDVAFSDFPWTIDTMRENETIVPLVSENNNHYTMELLLIE